MPKFFPPEDMDKECIALCTRLNELGDIQTYESCCGHLKERYMVFFETHDFVRLAKLFRCVNRNYSDGKWEILVDGTDMHPTFQFWLRSKEPFSSYEEMEESVNQLISNIDYWEDHAYDDHFGKDTNTTITDGYLVDTTPETIEGHERLVLEVGQKYEIHYGIHQGIYEYVGRVAKHDHCNRFSKGEHLFRKIETGEITFGYYGTSSPYEFTSIVRRYEI